MRPGILGASLIRKAIVLFMDWSTLAIEIQVCRSDISSFLFLGRGSCFSYLQDKLPVFVFVWDAFEFTNQFFLGDDELCYISLFSC